MSTSDLPRVTVYTDGGCRPNPGPGGWGAVILEPGRKPRELSGGEAATTNNRMELQAAIEALRSLPHPSRVEVVTDSQYLRRGITEWVARWRANGWQTAGKEPVSNQDLWRTLDLELDRHQVTWRWTRGHSGDRHNERADRLAAAAIPRPPLPLEDEAAVHLFAAAAQSGRAGAGGWGVVMRYRDRERALSGREPGGSANRMHLAAAVEGLEALRRPSRVHLYTVSDYLHDGATTWLPGWKARGFRTRDEKAVSHRDLWLRLDRQLARHRVDWHVLGGNDLPEGMAEARRVARSAASGEEPETAGAASD
jgi:ribonuclease HI